jgi:two-component system, NtrC family, nitrogen regulation response regulator GlnG
VTKAREVALEAETRPERPLRLTAAAALVPGLAVLYHADLERVGERALLPGLLAGREETLSRKEPAFAVAGGTEARPLADPYLSRMPLRLVPAAGGGLRIVCGETRTPVFVDGEPVTGESEIGAAGLERGVVLRLANRVVLLLGKLDPAPPPAALPVFGLVGGSAAVVEVRREVQRLAALDAPVLLRGETGTGKELVARALHDASRRARGPYLAVNLAAVPPALAAAELFGSARGAFTGADRPRPGYFRLAAGGTLLLDEIGETPAEVQALLLRALDEHEVQPVGGGEPQRVDLRLLAASDVELEAAVAAGRFRAPLLHRLASYEIRLPPLRCRRDDLGILLLHFLRLELAAAGAADRLVFDPNTERPWLPAALVARLAVYDWPGNVRQLRNVARQLAIAGADAAEAPWAARFERLLCDLQEEPRPAAAAADLRPPRKRYRPAGEVGDEELLAALRTHRWRLQPAAASLGISRTALYQKIDRNPAVRKASDLSRPELETSYARCGGDLDAMAESLEVSRRGLLRQIKRLGLAR